MGGSFIAVAGDTHATLLKQDGELITRTVKLNTAQIIAQDLIIVTLQNTQQIMKTSLAPLGFHNRCISLNFLFTVEATTGGKATYTTMATPRKYF